MDMLSHGQILRGLKSVGRLTFDDLGSKVNGQPYEVEVLNAHSYGTFVREGIHGKTFQFSRASEDIQCQGKALIGTYDWMRPRTSISRPPVIFDIFACWLGDLSWFAGRRDLVWRKRK
jgi:hypothetical protein